MFKQTIRYEQEYIWLKPVCDFFEIDYENQRKKISNDQILASNSTKKSSSLMFSDNYPRILLTKKGFIRWIQLINVTTVANHLRENFVTFQEMVFDYLFGNAEEFNQARISYTRLQKLERLYGKVGNEIKRLKAELHEHWNSRYLQTSMDFNDKKQLN